MEAEPTPVPLAAFVVPLADWLDRRYRRPHRIEQLVREIDALGGEMGKNTDRAGIQFRMLNRRKGPAMHGPRAQCDKKLYQFTMKEVIESQPGLTLRQEIVEKILTEDNFVPQVS